MSTQMGREFEAMLEREREARIRQRERDAVRAATRPLKKRIAVLEAKLARVRGQA